MTIIFLIKNRRAMALHNGATQRTLKSFITFLLEWGNAARNVQTHPSPV